jgi:hypothetical protein
MKVQVYLQCISFCSIPKNTFLAFVENYKLLLLRVSVVCFAYEYKKILKEIKALLDQILESLEIYQKQVVEAHVFASFEQMHKRRNIFKYSSKSF